MKRYILGVLVLLSAVSVSGLAQQPGVAEAVFEKWKQSAPADEVARTRFALAAVTRRTGDETAEVDLWVLGRAQEAVIDVQPVYFEKLPNGEYREEQAGSLTTTTVATPDIQRNARGNLGLKIVVPVTPNANALEIKWVSYAGGKIRNSTTVKLLLRDESSANLTRISLSR